VSDDFDLLLDVTIKLPERFADPANSVIDEINSYHQLYDGIGHITALLPENIDQSNVPATSSALSIDYYTVHEVTFNTDGGSTIAPIYVMDGGTVIEPSVPTKAGFEFAGWYKDDDLTDNFIFRFNSTATPTAITADTTIYAKWEAKSVNITVPTFAVPDAEALNLYVTLYDMNLDRLTPLDQSENVYTILSTDEIVVSIGSEEQGVSNMCVSTAGISVRNHETYDDMFILSNMTDDVTLSFDLYVEYDNMSVDISTFVERFAIAEGIGHVTCYLYDTVQYSPDDIADNVSIVELNGVYVGIPLSSTGLDGSFEITVSDVTGERGYVEGSTVFTDHTYGDYLNAYRAAADSIMISLEDRDNAYAICEDGGMTITPTVSGISFTTEANVQNGVTVFRPSASVPGNFIFQVDITMDLLSISDMPDTVQLDTIFGDLNTHYMVNSVYIICKQDEYDSIKDAILHAISPEGGITDLDGTKFTLTAGN